MLNSNTSFRLGAITGLLAVALGAAGAHGFVNGLLVRNATLDIWRTAVTYHLVHAVVLLVVAGRIPFARPAWILFFTGIVLFSGSLYLLALTGIHWLGAVTPVGGISLLAGWLSLILGRAKNAG